MAPEPIHIAVIGLGYVGLPLAVEFGKKFETLGFDINAQRIAELQAGQDRTLETTAAELAQATHLRYTLDSGRRCAEGLQRLHRGPQPRAHQPRG